MSKRALIAAICAVPFPWSLRRLVLKIACGFQIDRSAYISRWSLIMPRRLRMGPRSFIGPCTLCKGLELLQIEESGRIGALNWITAFPLGGDSLHFDLDPDRKPRLIVERHAAITNRHLIDCTDEVVLGEFSTFAGFRSQILTHSIDLGASRQRCRPVRIGHHCFVGTACVCLGGSSLPDNSVLGAHSLLNKGHDKSGYLYGGVPAKPITPVNRDDEYFVRPTGYVT